MSFQLRHQAWGLAFSVICFVTYWVVIIARAASDDVSFTKVAWEQPLLWMLGAGGAVYAAFYGASWWATRGTVRTDERDAEIARRADAAGSGLTALGALVALVMLALGAEAFWVAHVIFVVSFLGSVASIGLSLSAYTEGLDS